jgi:hypothetical protein
VEPLVPFNELSNSNFPDDFSFSRSGRISLPRLKSFYVRGNPVALKVFDLTNITVLDIGPSGTLDIWRPTVHLNLTSLSRRLTTLTLSSFELTINSSSPHFLPFLTTLALRKVRLWLPLQECLKTPKLRNFTLSEASLIVEASDPWIRDRVGDTGTPLLASFFLGVPELKTLSLLSFPIDERLVTDLQVLPRLTELTLGSVLLDITSLLLIDRLIEHQLFPGLVSFNLAFKFWDENIPMSYEEFMERCLTKWPKLALFCHEYEPSYSTDEDPWNTW